MPSSGDVTVTVGYASGYGTVWIVATTISMGEAWPTGAAAHAPRRLHLGARHGAAVARAQLQCARAVAQVLFTMK